MPLNAHGTCVHSFSQVAQGSGHASEVARVAAEDAARKAEEAAAAARARMAQAEAAARAKEKEVAALTKQVCASDTLWASEVDTALPWSGGTRGSTCKHGAVGCIITSASSPAAVVSGIMYCLSIDSTHAIW